MQREAVVNYAGPSLIVAGAGSGKTRVLTYRIAHLLKSGVRPSSVLALTFTNKAAGEMKERIKKLIGSDIANYLWMGTFHSVFAKILRIEAEYLGYTSKFTIYDTQDSRSLIKAIINELKLDPEKYQPAAVHARISSAKNNLVTSEAYKGNTEYLEFDKSQKKPELVNIYSAYVARCKKADAMDFDDILVNMNILFRDYASILDKYRQKFYYVLVDEYQDTNFAQYLIVKKLASMHRNICVVGDDAQSIYAFRGAKIENILNFKNDYKDFAIYKLEQNYRSTQNIVSAANSLIEKNEGQIPKKLYSENENGELIKIIRATTDTEESYQVVGSILDRIYQYKFDYSDFAILYRTNAQSRSFEESLRRRNIPYKIYGGISFYQRKEIKDILSYFRLAVNNNDEEALKRIINFPARGIGETTLERLIEFSNYANKTMWEVITNIGEYGININKGTQTKLLNFAALIQKFSGMIPGSDAYSLALQIARESGIVHEFEKDKSPESVSKFENIEELLNGIKEFVETETDDGELPTLDKFMQNIALLTDQDNEKPEDKNKICLMTVHAAKGLEFKCVYVVGLEENLFPSLMSVTSQKDIEEERRLFYVAITRAEKFATISYALTRYKWGSLTDCRPSRFIKEINPKFLELPPDEDSDFSDDFDSDRNMFNAPEKKTFFVKKQAYGSQLRQVQEANIVIPEKYQHLENAKTEEIQTGMSVLHDRFGIGKVLNVDGNPPDVKATVFFNGTGQKQLLLKFAKLKIIRE